jgi:hypothetical protein
MPRTAGLRVAALKPSLSLLNTESSISLVSVKSARTHLTSSGEGLSADGLVAFGRRGEPEVASAVRAGPDEGVVHWRGEECTGARRVPTDEDVTEEWPVIGLRVVAEHGEAGGDRRGLEEGGAEAVLAALRGGPDLGKCGDLAHL